MNYFLLMRLETERQRTTMGQSIVPLVTVAMILAGLHDVTAQGAPYSPAGDVRNCLSDTSRDVNRFEVLPGSGWDNLRNEQAGMVVALNYSQCRTTDDGRYVIPDFVNVYPVKTSRIDSYAEVINKWTEYVSSTSKDINADAGFHGNSFGISGSFSDDYTHVKTRQLEDDTLTTRVQARYVRYRAVLQPDMPLDPGFKYRLLSIAGALELDNQRQARFESQQLVREFGTHVSTGVDAGAAIIQEEQIKTDIKNHSSYSETALKVAAGFSFSTNIGSLFLGASQATVDAKSFAAYYLDNRTDSLVRAMGGNIVNKTNTTIEDWVKEMSNDLVAIGRSGEPIFNFINAQTVPEVPASTLLELVDMVRESVFTYYKVNTHPGCTDRTAQNFSPRANIDDGSCVPPARTTNLGGVYQTCNHTQVDAGDLCTHLTQRNPATGDFSCPTGYEAVPLYSGTKTREQVAHVCGSCWLIFGHCCHDESRTSSANYETFWCALTDPELTPSGYMFGGAYTPHLVNPVTSSMTCPHGYLALLLGENVRVCVSDQYSEAVENQLPFAGFFSCSTGNPLALGSVNSSLTAHMYSEGPESWPRRCPKGYSQFTTEIMPGDGCEVNHCVQAGALSNLKLPALKRPPFLHAPTGTPATQNVFAFDPSQNLWLKNGEAMAKNKSQRPQLAQGRFWAPPPRRHDSQKKEVEFVYVQEGASPAHKKEGGGVKGAEDNTMLLLNIVVLVVLIVVLSLALIVVLVKQRRGGKGQVSKYQKLSPGSEGHENHVTLSEISVDGKRKV
ncbi:macrophage-expressed gene 1 protein [Aplysia californica]|uniref:Macrophage-expressed gene 1 protein n=1 Tax=Aplysia californica TaxID=6500 RepID=A0ABM1ADK6_APLCA|nr:macrophage-expressed gene 1 protein [Aplysia californica]